VRFNFGGGHLARDSAVTAGGDRYVKLVRAPNDRFVAHYGLGEHNGAQRDPRVTLTTNTGSFADFRAGRLLVRHAAGWPLRTTRWTRLYLDGGGMLARKPGAAGTDTAPLASAPHEDLRTTAFALAGNTPTDFTDDERGGLTYTTPAFKRDLEVTGPIGLKLFASATATDFDWTVRITDVQPDGRSEWITDASLRASLRKVDTKRSLRNRGGQIVRPWLTYDTPELLTPGAVDEYQLDVIPTSNVFRKGHRLRLDILPQSGGLDSARTGGGGALTLARGKGHASSITLPVIGARCPHEQPLVAGTPRVRCARDYASATR
jgi:putative CocE/NonD family hydrolase